MRDMIEHVDNENQSNVRIGEADGTVSVKTYQDIYHQITGRTQQIRKRYANHLLIEKEDVEQLHKKIMQLCDVHNIVAKNETISIFYERDRKETFTSFDRFLLYNASGHSPTTSVVFKYNFSIIPAGLKRPQEYVLTIKLSSRLAQIREIDSQQFPPFKARLFRLLGDTPAEIAVEYADYVVARGFLEAFDEWVRGCRSEQTRKLIEFLRKWSSYFPKALQLVTACIVLLFSLQAVSSIASDTSTSFETWARFSILFLGGFYLLTNLADIAGALLEDAVDSFPELSCINLNNADKKIIDEFPKQKAIVFFRALKGCVLQILLGVAASLLSKLL